MTTNGDNNGWHGWRLQKDKMLATSGLALIGASFVMWVFTRELRYEFLATGVSLCGLGIAQWGDRKEK